MVGGRVAHTMTFGCDGTPGYVGRGLLNCVPHERALPISRVSPQNPVLLVREASDTTQTVAHPLQCTQTTAAVGPETGLLNSL